MKSVPSTLSDSPLNTADVDVFAGWMVPGAPADDAPLLDGWLLQSLPAGFVLLVFTDQPLALQVGGPVPVSTLCVPTRGLAAQRYDAQPGTAYLLRPDQHVAARWRVLDGTRVQAAVKRACGLGDVDVSCEDPHPSPLPSFASSAGEGTRGAPRVPLSGPLSPVPGGEGWGEGVLARHLSPSLNTNPNFSQPGQAHRQTYAAGDAFYERLIQTHQGLSDAQSELTNARLVLLLANHIGDLGVLQDALAAARASVPSENNPEGNPVGNPEGRP
jgi:3-(3-hydroxy-phenyl)propionate hydroxylase